MTIAIGSAGVPIGAYTRKVLDRLDAATRKAILANVRSEEPDVGGISAKLGQGAADAGFLYVTDVAATNGRLKAIELPAALQPEVAYGVAIVKGAPHREAARAFVDGAAGGRRTGRAEDARLRAAARRATVSHERRRPQLAPAVKRGRWFAPALVLALAVALTFLTLPVVAIFVRTTPGNLHRRARRPGRARRALAEPAHDAPRARDHRASSARRPPTCWRRGRFAATRSS